MSSSVGNDRNLLVLWEVFIFTISSCTDLKLNGSLAGNKNLLPHPKACMTFWKHGLDKNRGCRKGGNCEAWSYANIHWNLKGARWRTVDTHISWEPRKQVSGTNHSHQQCWQCPANLTAVCNTLVVSTEQMGSLRKGMHGLRGHRGMMTTTNMKRLSSAEPCLIIKLLKLD